MKYCSIDLETSGLDPSTCQILQFAAVIDDWDDPKPVDQLPYMNYIIKHDLIRGEPYALNMNKSIIEKLAAKIPLNKTELVVYPCNLVPNFSKFLNDNGFDLLSEKLNIAGKNFASFDAKFLNKIEGWSNIKVSHRVIDPAILYYKFGDKQLPSGDECLKRAGIDKTISHDALDDARDVIKLVRCGVLGKKDIK